MIEWRDEDSCVLSNKIKLSTTHIHTHTHTCSDDREDLESSIVSLPQNCTPSGAELQVWDGDAMPP